MSLSGNVVDSGVVEVPMGTPLRTIVYDIGGGVAGGKQAKAVHFGGPMGGSIPASLIDAPLDFDELAKLGAPIGAGGLLVMDEDTDMVEVARYFLEWLTKESCGKCVPCREGMWQTHEGAGEHRQGQGQERRHRAAGRPERRDRRRLPVRAGQDRRRPAQEHAALLQGRVRGADRAAATTRATQQQGAQRK